jgi:hypothetical protein
MQRSGRVTGAKKALRPTEPASGEVAQLVEHATENRGVGSSILPLATSTARLQETFRGQQVELLRIER